MEFETERRRDLARFREEDEQERVAAQRQLIFVIVAAFLALATTVILT